MFLQRLKHTPAACVLALTVNLFLFTSAHAGVPASADACQRLSDAAKIEKTKVLVIGYEGLFSSSPMNANSLARYRDKLAHGQKAHRPLFLFGGSFLTRGPLVRIVEAYKNKVEVLVFGRTANEGVNSVPAQCAKIWMSEKGEGRKVIIVGHSFGGGAAWQLAHSLETMNVPVEGVVTADPRAPSMCGGDCWNWKKPSNVARWENCYQSAPLKGNAVPGAWNHFLGAIGHVNVQNSPCVYQGIANRIDGVDSPITSAPRRYVADGRESGSSGTVNGSTITGGNKDSKVDEPSAKPKPFNALENLAKSLFGGSERAAVVAEAPPASPAGERAATANSVAASELAQKTVVPNVVHYTKPGGGPESTAARSASGASGTAQARAAQATASGGGSGAGEAETGASDQKRALAASADATSAAKAMWFADGGPGAAGAAPSLGGGPAVAGLPTDAGGKGAETPAGVASLFGASDTSVPGATSESVSSPAEPSADTSLFERVHTKLKKLTPKS